MQSCLIFAQQNTSIKQKAFTPGTLWLDNNGKHINAHGGGFFSIIIRTIGLENIKLKVSLGIPHRLVFIVIRQQTYIIGKMRE